MKQLFNSSEYSKMRALRFSELLNINGGYSGSSGGLPSPKGGGNGYSGSSGGNKTPEIVKPTKTTYKKSEAYSCLSGIQYTNRERYLIIGGRAYSSVSGFIKVDTGNPNLADKDWNPSSVKINSGVEVPGYIKDLTDKADGTLTKKIADQIAADLKAGEIVYGKDGIMCDNYVQSLLQKCGVNYEKYFAGAADKYTVAEHIANLNKNGNYDSSIVEKGNSYVVFMSGSKTLSDGTVVNYQPHCAIMTVAADGTCYMTDNSSGNKQESGQYGGLGITYGKSVSEVQSKFAYSNFYYQKVS